MSSVNLECCRIPTFSSDRTETLLQTYCRFFNVYFFFFPIKLSVLFALFALGSGLILRQLVLRLHQMISFIVKGKEKSFLSKSALLLSNMDRYDILEHLGEGTYGVVYKGRDRQTGRFVAMKKIKLETEEEGIPSTTLREVSTLRLLRHPNVVELNDVIHSAGRLHLVFEFVDKDLKQYMKASNRPMNPELIRSYTLQILRGLDFCHTRAVMHR